MNEIPTVVEHLKTLAQGYHDAQLALQAQYRETESPEQFFVELKHREAALLSRFRLVQKHLLASLEDEELEKAIELSRIFDEIRVINEFLIQKLVGQESETGVD
ncbi:MAG: hypothetical protein PVJ11_00465 [Syntrophobacterales bacterium]|jgi:hypothetical protein